jgi:hypothetical protein
MFVAVSASAAESLELRNSKHDEYRVFAGNKELAVLMPDAWQGNLNIIAPYTNLICGVHWPHFLMHSQDKWLTDKVESEGFKLAQFEVQRPSGPVISYCGKWQFRDFFVSSECHFIWYDAARAMQFHLVTTELRMLNDVPEISAAWVEFMTRENHYTTVAARVRGGRIVTMDVSRTGSDRNMHYLDGLELADAGWITIYGSRQGQNASVAMVPLSRAPGPARPRINNGHVDNIEIHMLDPRTLKLLKRDQTLSLKYLLIVGPDRKGWAWIDPAVQSARDFMADQKDLLVCPHQRQ